MFYKLIIERIPKDLERAVQDAINSGFVPIGGVSVTKHPREHGYVWAQAMATTPKGSSYPPENEHGY